MRHLKNIGLFTLLLFSLRSYSATFIVTDTNDTTKITSLRGAIIAANHSRGNNTIILGEGLNSRWRSGSLVYHLTISGPDENEGRKGDLNITQGRLTIKSAAPNVIIVATAFGDRVFNVSKNAWLMLENLTIKGGTAPVSSALFGNGEFGGAIYNAGTLTLENCIITNNSSGGGKLLEGNAGGTSGGDGGGIYNSGLLQAYDSVIVGNASGGGLDGADGGNGGGIRNDGECLLQNCIVNGNNSGSGGSPAGNAVGMGGGGGDGGGIFNSGTMILDRCIVSANAAGLGLDGGSGFMGGIFPPGGPGGNGGNGGGIYNVGQLEIDFSTINGNNSGNGGNGQFGLSGNSGLGGNGGGIFNAGELILKTSTVSSNACGSGGNGGIGFSTSGFFGAAGGCGGGIYNSGLNQRSGLNAGALTLTSCTIVLNVCGAGGNGGNSSGFLFQPPLNGASSGGDGGNGGGILNGADTNAIFVSNTLIAENLPNVGGAAGTNIFTPYFGQQASPPQIGNPGADGTGFDLSGNFTSGGFNLISTGDGSNGFVNGVNADQVGTDANMIDPLLGPLQINGGFTPTHALLTGSPAIDQGKCFGIHTDQRGSRRPYIYSSITKPHGGDGSDIGAFELDTH